jgi:hypothetical protein
VGRKRCAEFVLEKYSQDPTYRKEEAALQWSNRQIEEQGYNIATMIEPNRRKATVAQATLQNLPR